MSTYSVGDYLSIGMTNRNRTVYEGEVLAIVDTEEGPAYTLLLSNFTQTTPNLESIKKIVKVDLTDKVIITIKRGVHDYEAYVSVPGNESYWFVPSGSLWDWQRPLLTESMAVALAFKKYPDALLLTNGTFDKEVSKRRQS